MPNQPFAFRSPAGAMPCGPPCPCASDIPSPAAAPAAVITNATDYVDGPEGEIRSPKIHPEFNVGGISVAPVMPEAPGEPDLTPSQENLPSTLVSRIITVDCMEASLHNPDHVCNPDEYGVPAEAYTNHAVAAATLHSAREQLEDAEQDKDEAYAEYIAASRALAEAVANGANTVEELTQKEQEAKEKSEQAVEYLRRAQLSYQLTHEKLAGLVFGPAPAPAPVSAGSPAPAPLATPAAPVPAPAPSPAF